MSTILDLGDGTAVELAGERIVIDIGDDGMTTVTFNDKGTGRVCGGCSACCKLMPVPSVAKPAMTRCEHQKAGKGCVLHEKTTFPIACRTFACLWLASRDTAGMPRPDRAHYVIDPTTDYVIWRPANGEPTEIPAFQVWCDPAFPEAYKAPSLRDWMLRMATKYRAVTMVRFNAQDAITVFPPVLNKDREWHEVRGQAVARNDMERAVVADFKVAP